MPTITASPIKGRRMRISRLDVCGRPVSGVGGVIVTNGFVQVQMSSNYEEGTDYRQKNAAGEYCVNDRGPNVLNEAALTIDFCLINPSTMEIIADVDLFTTAGDVTGFQVGGAPIENRWALEVWQEVAGTGACAGGAQAYYYWVWPHLGNSQIGDYTIQDGSSTFQVQAATRAASAFWGQGPGTPKYVPSAVTGHWGANYTTSAPPAADEQPGTLTI